MFTATLYFLRYVCAICQLPKVSLQEEKSVMNVLTKGKILTVVNIGTVEASLYKIICWCLDVITAYKELQREKIALEESLKALSLSQSHNEECDDKSTATAQSQRELDVANEQEAADSSVCSELSDSLVTLLYIFWCDYLSQRVICICLHMFSCEWSWYPTMSVCYSFS